MTVWEWVGVVVILSAPVLVLVGIVLQECLRDHE